MSFKARVIQGPCVAIKPAALGPDSQYVADKAGVGKGGQNLPAEVLATKKALNKVKPEQGGPLVPLVENGNADESLNAAILRFKSFHDPTDKTALFQFPMASLVTLNQIALADRQLVQSDDEVLTAVRLLLSEARECIRAARMNVEGGMDALNGIALPAGAPDNRLRLLNRHFAMDRMPDKKAMASFVHLTYSRMLQVFSRPGELWGPFAFDFDKNPSNKAWLAYTRAGGFFRSGEVEDGSRLDTIYLCTSMRLATRDLAIQTIVHELAHFCGPKAGDVIDDHGYGLPDQPKMTRLPPYYRMLNAECYGNLAFEAKFGRDMAGFV